jgi:hypothetical protein
MSPRCDGREQCELVYQGYVARIKNTFIDLVPQRSGTKRSLSCSARFGLSNSDSVLEKPEDIKPAVEFVNGLNSASTICSVTPFAETPPDGGYGPFAPSGRSSTCSDDSEAAPVALRGILRPSLSSDDGAHQVNEEFAEEQYQKYLVNTDNGGKTLMWHGLPTKFQVEPDLLRILDAIKAEGVQCLYLPLNHWEKKGNPRGKCRNKGYAFVHFRTEAAASDFTEKISAYSTGGPGLTATTEAARQGISANLRALASVPQKRAAAGALFLSAQETGVESGVSQALKRVSMATLRNLAGRKTTKTRWLVARP